MKRATIILGAVAAYTLTGCQSPLQQQVQLERYDVHKKYLQAEMETYELTKLYLPAHPIMKANTDTLEQSRRELEIIEEAYRRAR